MTPPTERTWVAGTVVVAVLLLVASWFLLVGPVRAEAASLRSQRADAQAQNQALAARTVELRQQFANLPDEQRKLDALEEALPSDVALPTLLRDISGYADRSRLTLMSVIPGTPAPLVDPAASAAATTSDTTATTTTTTTTATTASTTAIPVTTTVIGGFFDAQSFLRLLQTEMPRAFLVNDVSVTAEAGGDAAGGRPATMAGDVTMVITADVFSRPSPLDAGTGASAAAPAPASPTPGASTAPDPSAAPAPSSSSDPSATPTSSSPAATVPAPAASPSALT